MVPSTLFPAPIEVKKRKSGRGIGLVLVRLSILLSTKYQISYIPNKYIYCNYTASPQSVLNTLVLHVRTSVMIYMHSDVQRQSFHAKHDLDDRVTLA